MKMLTLVVFLAAISLTIYCLATDRVFLAIINALLAVINIHLLSRLARES